LQGVRLGGIDVQHLQGTSGEQALRRRLQQDHAGIEVARIPADALVQRVQQRGPALEQLQVEAAMVHEAGGDAECGVALQRPSQKGLQSLRGGARGRETDVQEA
jgi:hypothetical protein